MTTKKTSRKSSALPDVPVGLRWLLPTNHYNLMYWLAVGLILPESAMSKYFADCLRTAPGWLPLFRDSVARDALDAATTDHGMSVLLDIDMTSVSGMVQAVTASGDLIECHFPAGVPRAVTCILVPAPLPSHFIRQVSFATKDALENYRLKREESANLATFDVPLVVEPFPTTVYMDQPWMQANSLPTLSPLPVKEALQQGAMLASLHHIGNRGELSLAVAKAAFANADGFMLESAEFRDAMNQSLSHGVNNPALADFRIRLYWGVVDHMRGLNNDKIGVERAVLDYLEHTAANDEKNRSDLKDFANDLQQLLGMGGSTGRELFAKYKGAFAHALLLLFLRKHTDLLFDFDTPSIVISEADQLAAAILFSIRENWKSTPERLRKVPGLYPAVTQRMAKSLHQAIGTDMDMGAIEPYRTLRELFLVDGERWSPPQKLAALELARTMKWIDAIETRVQLGKESYRLEWTAGGMQIVLPGDVKAVSTEVRVDSLLNYLAQLRWPIDPKIEKETRVTLQGK